MSRIRGTAGYARRPSHRRSGRREKLLEKTRNTPHKVRYDEVESLLHYEEFIRDLLVNTTAGTPVTQRREVFSSGEVLDPCRTGRQGSNDSGKAGRSGKGSGCRTHTSLFMRCMASCRIQRLSRCGKAAPLSLLVRFPTE